MNSGPGPATGPGTGIVVGARLVGVGLLLGVLGASGCRTRLLELPFDGSAPSDLSGSPPDLSACIQHRLRQVPLTDMHFLEPGQLDSGQLALGSIVRVLLSVPLGPCDALGDIQKNVKGGNVTDVALFTARIWQSTADCGPAGTAFRVGSILSGDGLSKPMLVVGDGAPGGTVFINASIDPIPLGASCATSLQRGDRCQLDCQCARSDPRLHCILDRPAPDSGSCQYPCEQDSDCPASLAHCETSADFTCAPATPGPCAGPCPLGQTCNNGGACVPSARSMGTCGCDRDCPMGLLCTDAGLCVVPCTSDGDCLSRHCQNGAC